MATTTAPKAQEHIGDTEAMQNHDHDLIHELNKRLDAVWRYDQYIANAEGKEECQNLWRTMKKQDLENIKKLKELVKGEIKSNCF